MFLGLITYPKLIFLCAAVFLAGFIDSIAGGGGVISIPDASSTTKGVVKLCSDISATTSANPGGAADGYAVKVYVNDQIDAISGTYVYVSNLVTDLSGVTGTGSGGGDNPATAWAVKQALSSLLTYEEIS